MKIEFVNHASLIVDTNQSRILCDPWLSGRAFNDGWSLLSPTPSIIWSNITHIWLSHEHPDHFHPPSLLSIPQGERSRIQILYQATRDRKVINWCRAQGFRVQELPEHQPVRLGHDLTVLNGKFPTGDSWLLIDDGTTRFLNMNDCDTKTMEIARSTAARTGRVDVLATQFSYAAWVGDTRDERVKAARRKLEQVYLQAQCFRPRYLIPFASFAVFSHPESFVQNDGANRIHEIFPELEQRLPSPIVLLYPGDRWTVGGEWDNQPAIKKYADDYTRFFSQDGRTLKSASDQKTVDLAVLEKKATNYNQRLTKLNPLLRFFPIEPTQVWLLDHRRAVQFDLKHGLTRTNSTKEQCDIAMGSDSMAFWFDHSWGGTTVYISGRMSAHNKQRYRRAYRYFYISNANNRGESWPWFDLKRRVWRRIQKFRARAGAIV